MGKVWRSNSNLGSHPFLENTFLTCGESNCLEMHAQAIIHPYLSFLTHSHGGWALSRSWSLLSFLPHDFLVVFFIFSMPRIRYSVLSTNRKKGTTILGVWRGLFFLMSKLGASLMSFYSLPIFLHGWEIGFVLLSKWEKRPMILGALRGCFSSHHPVELIGHFPLMISIVSSLFHTQKFIFVLLNG